MCEGGKSSQLVHARVNAMTSSGTWPASTISSARRHDWRHVRRSHWTSRCAVGVVDVSDVTLWRRDACVIKVHVTHGQRCSVRLSCHSL